MDNVEYMSGWSFFFRTAVMISLLSALFTSCIAFGSWEGSEGILIKSDETDWVRYDDYISTIDVFSLLDNKGNLSLSSDMSMQVITIEEGGALSPDIILPVPEIIYVTSGTIRITVNDEEFLAESGDAVYIPSQTTRKFETGANETVQFFSVIEQISVQNDEESPDKVATKRQENSEDIVRVISADMVTPLEPGKKDLNQSFYFSRLIHPLQGPYNTGFDLGTVRISKDFNIPDHYVEERYQLITVLSGSGYISVGCNEYPVDRNDIIYVAPGAVMSLVASEDMHLLFLTNPYYQEKFDRAIPYACDYLY